MIQISITYKLIIPEKPVISEEIFNIMKEYFSSSFMVDIKNKIIIEYPKPVYYELKTVDLYEDHVPHSMHRINISRD